MKKIIFTLCLLVTSIFLMAQEVPQAINFQAIARDANSEVMANTPIMIQLTIIDGAPDGQLVYREIRSLTTNAYGSFSFQIGRDPYMAVGEFANIDWAGGRKFLKIDYDPTATLSFNLSLGTVEFVSVPYAFTAGSVSYIDATGANDGDVLAYNSTTGRFEPRALQGSGVAYATPNLSAVLSEGNSANNTTISDLAAPVNANDAATKAYVDALVAQLQTAIDALNPTSVGTTGSLNGHEYVDLGLPSGTRWATCNVGSDTPEGYGNYYAWGETTTKTAYDWSTYRYCNGSANTLTKYCNSSYYGNNGFIDTLTVLEACDDVATANWGEGWRMPMKTEINELINNCTVTWTIQNGVNGHLFTGPNGNSIFLPAGGNNLGGCGSLGYYWSSSLTLSNNGAIAANLYFDSNYYVVDDDIYYCYRYGGQSVRAVCDGNNIGENANISVPTVTTCSASSITVAGATLSGNVTSDGGATVIPRGFLYGTNSSNLTQTVQSDCGIGSFTKTLIGLTPGTTYFYKAYATNSAGTVYGEVSSFTTDSAFVTPTGYVSGYGYVDLGLPSGTKWATCNVGATNPEDYGNYYSWGETTQKVTYTWETYIYAEGITTYNPKLTKYCDISSYGNNGFVDNLTTLYASDDAATANWGAGWRMPTYDEINELLDNCIHVWATLNGVNGCLFTGPNGNSIFLPAAGYHSASAFYDIGTHGSYWSSSLGTDYPFYAWDLSFYSGYYNWGGAQRYYGYSVRPVCASQN